MGYFGLVGMTWGWLVAFLMGQVSDSMHATPDRNTNATTPSSSWSTLWPSEHELHHIRHKRHRKLITRARLSSAYPTSGGLYYWAYMTAAPRYKLFSCYICAWSMVLSTPLACCSITYSVHSCSIPWYTLIADIHYISQAAQLLISAVQLAHPDYVTKSWHIYVCIPSLCRSPPC
jgi:hypothetical protein